jgi:hypothetical protein
MAEQNVTITRTGGQTPITVRITEDDGNNAAISEAEARAAVTAALAQTGVTRASLVGATITVGTQTGAPSVGADTYLPPASPTVPTPTQAARGGTTAASGMGNGAEIEGFYQLGWGDHAHSGGGVRASYVPTWRLTGDSTTLHLDLPVGVEYAHDSRDYQSPGGESFNSTFDRFGLRVVPRLRLVPSFLDRRAFASIGLALGVGGFWTPPSTIVSTPPNCTPGDFGRGDCPMAGPLSGNGGQTGVENFDQVSSRGTGGAYVSVAAPVAVGGTVARGSWGRADLTAGAEVGYMQLLPNDGHGFGMPFVNFFAGVSGTFGGSGVEVSREPEGPQRDADTVDATASAVTPTARDGHNYISLSDDDVKRLANLPQGATILGVKLDGGAEDTSAPYEFEATTGNHTLTVRYTRPGETTPEHVRDVRIGVATPAPVVVPEGTTTMTYGALPNIPAIANRLQPNIVGGQPVEQPIPIGTIQTASDLPAHTTYQIFVDGNAVGSRVDLPADSNPTMTVPASVTNDTHLIQVRVYRGGTQEVQYPITRVTVGPSVPATVTMTAAPTGSGGRWSPHNVTVTASGPLLPTDQVFLVWHGAETAAGTVGGTGTPTTFSVCIGSGSECSVGGLSERIRGDSVTIRVKRGGTVVGEVAWNTAAPRHRGHRTQTHRPARPLP